jgi:hypothetical protein
MINADRKRSFYRKKLAIRITPSKSKVMLSGKKRGRFIGGNRNKNELHCT